MKHSKRSWYERAGKYQPQENHYEPPYHKHSRSQSRRKHKIGLFNSIKLKLKRKK